MKAIKLILTLLTLCIVTSEAQEKPNIVLLLSDDQAWTDYGFMGHDTIKTPHLDRLATRSAVFKRGYVPIALCRPSLMTLISGLYPHVHGVTGNDPTPLKEKNPEQYNQLRAGLIANIDKHPALPKLLAQQGYISHQSGKWWEGDPKRAGFTEGMTRGFPKPGGRHGDDGLKIGRKGMEPVFDFIDRAAQKKKPFFIWYAPFMPHSPHNPPARILKKYQKEGRPESIAKYYAMVEWFDETCGQLIDHIDDKGLTQNTIFVYLSDNGWVQNPKNKTFLTGSKQAPQEAGVRQPTLYSWPGKIKAGDYSDVITSLDFMPTMLSAAGAKIPNSLPGIDLMPLMTEGKKLTREAIFGESFAHDVADIHDPEASLLYRWCIEGKWKLLLTYDGKTGRYARLHQRENATPVLTDLLASPDETTNLAAQHPDIVKRLAKRIDQNWHLKTAKLIGKLPE
ncbi:MAG: sulfatase [Verrucomicrobiales bacterium]|nr:sulfatase [Verrucomicrobiales bacterium]